MRNPTAKKLLKVSSHGEKRKSWTTEILGLVEVGELEAVCRFARRSLQRKKYPNSRKYVNAVPKTVWLDEDEKIVLGRLERAIREGKETVDV